MEFFEAHSFLIILSESIKLLPKNGKLLAFVSVFSVVLHSSFFFLFSYSLQSLMANMFVNFQLSFMPDPSSFDTSDPTSFTPKTGSNPAQITGLLGQLKEDFAILFAVLVVFLLVSSIISFFSAISTILVSSVSYRAKNLSLKELFTMIGRTWTRPMITSFYVSGLGIGYNVVVVMLVAPLLIHPNLAAFYAGIFIAITAFIYYLYLFVAWGLAVVVSVVEESCYGMEAMGKAAALVKGNRFHGFLVHICFNLVGLIIFQGYKMIVGNNGLMNPIMYGLFLVTVSVLAKILLVVVYTVLYFQCKKHHGEEIELHSTLQYTTLPTAQLANDMP